MKKPFYENFSTDKYKINSSGTVPIEMDLFLSFLTIKTEKSTSHLGRSNGWTQHFNTLYRLKITGGWVGKVEYIHSLEFGTKLDNPWNDYVNPFYMFDVFTDEGKQFFTEYYKSELTSVAFTAKNNIAIAKNKLQNCKAYELQLLGEIKAMTTNLTTP